MSESAILGSNSRDPRRPATRRGATPSSAGPRSGRTPERQDLWIGVDFARWTAPTSSPIGLALVAIALVVALGIAALRIDLIRTRYALAEAMDRESALLLEQRELIARQRQLRDPTVLARLAEERGFRPVLAARVLVDPNPATSSALSNRAPVDSMVAPSALPNVAAAPPVEGRSTNAPRGNP